MELVVRISAILVFLIGAGCATFEDGYATRFGLANPEYPVVPPAPTDETYSGGSVGQEYIEEYDKKYHEKAVLPPAADAAEEPEEIP